MDVIIFCFVFIGIAILIYYTIQLLPYIIAIAVIGLIVYIVFKIEKWKKNKKVLEEWETKKAQKKRIKEQQEYEWGLIREKFIEETNNEIDMSDIDTYNGREFEIFLKDIFVRLGYNVEVTKASGEEGADLFIEKDGEISIIQAKRKATKVGNKAIQEVYSGKNYYIKKGFFIGKIRYNKLDKAIVITNNYYTPAAIELAIVHGVILWDRKKLIEEIRNTYG